MSRTVDSVNGALQVFYAGLPEVEESSDVLAAQIAWDDMVENFRYSLVDGMPSFEDCDNWDHGSELRTVMENRLVEVVVSEYCGLVSVSVVAKEVREGLARRWFAGVEKHFKVAVECFGTRLNCVGRFSNGEGVYERAS